MKVLTVVGARPQFIKAWPVSRALAAAGVTEWLVHTGQHYDDAMSQVFFDELGLPRPATNLGVGSGSHATQTAAMLVAIESEIQARRPDWVMVYGDTNSTLAGALAAAKLGVPVAHVEAGLRSFNRSMPEEHNRVLTDHASDLLLCPTRTAVEHLAREGVTKGVHLVGDVMLDAVLHFAERARTESQVLSRLGVTPGSYYLATIHRAYNTDDPASLAAVLTALDSVGAPVIFPIHPRTRSRLPSAAESTWPNLHLTDPVGYLDMLALEQSARAILTDSGGVQKEAFFLGVPCVTLRPETEWVETVEAGWNVLVGSDAGLLRAAALRSAPSVTTQPQLFGDGHAAEKIAALLRS